MNLKRLVEYRVGLHRKDLGRISVFLVLKREANLKYLVLIMVFLKLERQSYMGFTVTYNDKLMILLVETKLIGIKELSRNSRKIDETNAIKDIVKQSTKSQRDRVYRFKLINFTELSLNFDEISKNLCSFFILLDYALYKQFCPNSPTELLSTYSVAKWLLYFTLLLFLCLCIIND